MNRFLTHSLTVLLAAAAVSCGRGSTSKAPATGPDAVVARVNGTAIKRSDLDAALEPFRMQMAQMGQTVSPEQAAQMDRSILEELITRTLLLETAKKKESKDVDGLVQARLEQMMIQAGGPEQLKQALTQAGVSEADFRDKLREMVLINQLLQGVVAEKAAVSDEDLQKFYDANRDQFKEPEQVRASHVLILVPGDATAEVKQEKRAKIDEVRARLVKGEEFEVVAKEVSEDPGSAARGGDLGLFGRGQMVPEFDQAAFSLKDGELSEVVTTQFGHHILKVTEHKAAREVPLDEAREQLRAYLQREKSQTVAQAYIAELRQGATVEVLLPPLPAPAAEAPLAPAEP